MQSLLSLPEAERRTILQSLTDEQAAAFKYDWRRWARSGQLPPEGDWTYWLLLAGRGFGKTRTGAEWVRSLVENGKAGRIALVAPTAADARDVMVEGESGILAISPPWNRPEYQPSKRRLIWPNGAMATTYSAEEPDRLRGPQHDAAWADELAAWSRPETWDMLMFGLRLGDPRCVVTTTPRPLKIIKDLLKRDDCVTTRGSTFDNRANLAPSFFASIVSRYEGTRLGRQELYAEVLDDNPDALWRRSNIDRLRIAHKDLPDLARIVVAVDPQISDPKEAAGEQTSETGIVVCAKGTNGEGYVLADVSRRASPRDWAQAAVDAYHLHRADRIVAEQNQGGAMVEYTLRTVDTIVPITLVHASRGKVVRAEPIAALYEQGRIHHAGAFNALEDQLCEWVPGGPSPDRLDALVWGFTELMLKTRELRFS